MPDPEDVKLGSVGAKWESSVLYADLAESTSMVQNFKPWFSAEVYKAYLLCAARIVRAHEGVITAYDGDRIMAVFIGKSKCSNAANVSLKINHACSEIIMPAIKRKYPKTSFELKQVVGIDASSLLVARTGIRKHNDLVWVGRAANYAAKLCSKSDEYATWITEEVYNRLNEGAKLSRPSKEDMWESHYWEEREITMYRSSWLRGV